ncbi:MAG: hypothetical protein R2751_07130 [Bacteroidales bacterium]
MKKVGIVLLATFVLTQVSIGQSGTWVKTGDGQVACTKVAVGNSTTKVVLASGEKQSIPTSAVLSYAKEGTEYVKMPRFDRGAKSGEEFMELVKTRDNMSLYRFRDMGSFRYVIYKGTDFYLEVTNGLETEFEDYFGIAMKN